MLKGLLGFQHFGSVPRVRWQNENALKAIRQKRPGRRKILAFEGAFAGRTSLMAEITHSQAIKKGLPEYGEVLRIPFSQERALSSLKEYLARHSGEIAGFFIELVQGDGGCWTAPKSFFLPLLELSKKEGIAIWFDEVQTFLRTGEAFAFETLGLGEFVDVCTIGKALNLSGTFYTKEWNPEPGLLGGTFASATSSFYIALKILDVLDQGFFGLHGRIQTIHKDFLDFLKPLEKRGLISHIDGMGIMMGLTPLDGKKETVDRLLKLCFERGLMAYSCGREEARRLRFLLPAITQREHLKMGVDLLESSLEALKEERA